MRPTLFDEPGKPLGSVEPAQLASTAPATDAGPGDRPKTGIFLCHNRLDRALVREVAEGLELEFGIPHFLDEYAIPIGEEFLPWIEQALGGSHGCAIFLGPNGWGPTHFWEAERALERYRQDPGFRLLPVTLGQPSAEDLAKLGAGSVFGRLNRVELAADQVDRESIAKLRAAMTGEEVERDRGPARLTPYLLRRDAARWRDSREAALLYRGRELREAEALAAAAPDLTAGPHVTAFLAASGKAATARLRRLAGVAVAVSLALGVLALVALQRGRLARSRELAALATASEVRDRGLLLAEAAYRVEPTLEARASLFRQLTRLGHAKVVLHGPQPGVRAVAVTADGNLVAAGGDGGRIHIWDLATPGAPRFVLEPPPVPSMLNDRGRLTNQVHALAFAGGRLLAAYEWGPPRLWNLKDLTVREIAGWPPSTTGTAQVSTAWEGADPEPPERRGRRPAVSLAIDGPHDEALLGDFGGRLFAVDLATATVKWEVATDVFAVDAVTRMPGAGPIVFADGAGNLFTVDAASRRVERVEPRRHDSKIVLLRAEGAERLVSLDATGRLVRWRQQQARLVPELTLSLPILPMAAGLSPRDGLLLTAPIGGEVRTWTLAGEEREDLRLEGHALPVLAIGCSDRGAVCASAGVGGEVLVWNLDEPHPLLASSREMPDLPLAARRNGKDEVQVLNQTDGGLSWLRAGGANESGALHPFDGLRAVAVQREGEEVAVAFGDQVLLFPSPALEHGTSLTIPGEADEGIHRLWVSEDGELVGGASRRDRLLTWRRDLPASPLLNVVSPEAISSLIFSKDHRYVFIGGFEGSLLRWDLRYPEEPPKRQAIARGPIFALASARSDQLFAGSGAGDRRIRLVDEETLKVIRELPERHTSSISELIVPPEPGRTLISLADDGLAVLWDLDDWRELAALPHGRDTLFQTAILDGAGRLVTVSDRRLWVWELSDAQLLASACRIANRELTREEWAENVGGQLPTSGCPAPNSPSRPSTLSAHGDH